MINQDKKPEKTKIGDGNKAAHKNVRLNDKGIENKFCLCKECIVYYFIFRVYKIYKLRGKAILIILCCVNHCDDIRTLFPEWLMFMAESDR